MKIKLIPLVLVLLMLMSYTNLFKLNVYSDENTSLVTNYLLALKEKNIEQVVETSVYTRVPDKIQYRDWLYKILDDPNQQIFNFKIVDKNDSKNSIIYAEIEFLNGDVIEFPFRIENNLVYIDEFDNIPKIKEGIEIPYEAMETNAQVATWDATLSFDDNPDIRYSNAFTYNSDNILLNFRQYSLYTADVQIQYAVVKRGLLSDTIYASEIVYGANQDYPKQLTLRLGSGYTFNNFSIRIKNLNNYYRTRVFGEGYC